MKIGVFLCEVFFKTIAQLLTVIYWADLHAPYEISTIAGNGQAGYSGDGSPATAAQLSFPNGVCLDSLGNIFIGDTGNFAVRFIPAVDTILNSIHYTAGNIYTIAGNGQPDYSGDEGQATNANLFYSFDVKADNYSNIYIADSSFKHATHIRKVNLSTGIITSVAGTSHGYSGDGGPATSAQLYLSTGIDLDSTGNIYIADSGNNRIRFVPAANTILNQTSYSAGNIYTIAGNGTAGYSGDGGIATSAELSSPNGIKADGSGNIYFTDNGNNCIRKINLSTGIITTVAGNGQQGYSADGTAANSAQFSNPSGIWVDHSNNIYFTDASNNLLRFIPATTNGPYIAGNVYTIAGNGQQGYSGDGSIATAAEISGPQLFYIDNNGIIYFTDTYNNVIRKLTYRNATTISSTSPTLARSITAVTTSAASQASEASEESGSESEDFHFSHSPDRIKLGMGIISSELSNYHDNYSFTMQHLEKVLSSAKTIQKLNDSVSIWGSGVYTKEKQGEMYGNPGSSTRHYGMMLGTHYYHTPSKQIFGVAVDFGMGDSKQENDTRNTTVNKTKQATIYYSIAFKDGWRASLHGAFMEINGCHHRPYGSNEGIAISYSRSYATTETAEISYRYILNPMFNLKATIIGTHARTKQLAYKEDNAGNYNIFYDSASLEEGSLKLGIKGYIYAKKNEKLTYGIYPEINYTRFVKPGKMRQRSTTIGTGVTSRSTIGTPGKDLLGLGIGAGFVDSESGKKVQVGYSASYQQYKHSQEIMLKAGTKF